MTSIKILRIQPRKLVRTHRRLVTIGKAERLRAHGLLYDVSNSTPIPVFTGIILSCCSLQHGSEPLIEGGLGLGSHGKMIIMNESVSDLHEFCHAVVFEHNDRWEPAAHAWIVCHELIHLARVACKDYYKFIAVVFHHLDERVECFAAEAVLCVFNKGIWATERIQSD